MYLENSKYVGVSGSGSIWEHKADSCCGLNALGEVWDERVGEGMDQLEEGSCAEGKLEQMFHGSWDSRKKRGEQVKTIAIAERSSVFSLIPTSWLHWGPAGQESC